MRTHSNPYRQEEEMEPHLSHHDPHQERDDLPGFRRHRTRIRFLYLHIAEILAIALSYLERSRIARFFTAKLSMGAVVEVTSRFGAPAGHRLSTFLSLLVAEPMLITLLVMAVILLFNLILFLIHLIRRKRRRAIPDYDYMNHRKNRRNF